LEPWLEVLVHRQSPELFNFTYGTPAISPVQMTFLQFLGLTNQSELQQ
jgi:hypothetical protein